VVLVVMTCRAGLCGHGAHRQHDGDGDESGEGHASFFLLGENARVGGAPARIMPQLDSRAVPGKRHRAAARATPIA